MTQPVAREPVAPARASLLYDPRVRGILFQCVLVAGLAWLFWEAFVNATTNMAARGIPTNFDFWDRTAGFDINFTLIDYSAVSTYGRAFWVGLWNTLLVAVIGIVFASVIGFVVGIARLSSNWLVAKCATVYVETLRNIPLLLQLLFWYNAVLKPLPQPRQSLNLGAGVFLNNRGLQLPQPLFGPQAAWALYALGAAFVASVALAFIARRHLRQTGRAMPTLAISVALIVGLPMLTFALAGAPVTFDTPVLRGFNFSGGLRILPELIALLVGLTLYTAAFIAEIVRAGIQSVSRGQVEAALALGLRRGDVLRRIVIPQAMRVITPPLTNQFLNVTKNSSLAVFIGYPDLVQVFAGTVLNQTGAAVQVIGVTMAVYLAISLVTSGAMALYNRRFALVER